MSIVNFKVNGNEMNMPKALDSTEALGVDAGLTHKEVIRLRLLAEELFGLIRGIAGEVEADYTAKQNQKSFELSLEADVDLDRDMRRQFLSVSTSGRNESARGFMGKIRDMISAVALYDKDQALLESLSSFDLMGMVTTNNYSAAQAVYNWSMLKYRQEIEKTESYREHWDELEKSIVASIADEVKVTIIGTKATVTIYKSF